MMMFRIQDDGADAQAQPHPQHDQEERKPSRSAHRGLVPRLMPMTLEPHRPSGNAVPLAMLRRIERVEFLHTTEHLGAIYFVMNVHQRHGDSRLPTSTSLLSRIRRRSGDLDRAPDYYLGARFSEFASLRASVSELMCVNARFTCEYCTRFDEYIKFRVKQPRWIIKVGARIELRKTILESFINDFLSMTLQRCQADDKCQARAKVPFVMARFLRERFPTDRNAANDQSNPTEDQGPPNAMPHGQHPHEGGR